MCVKAGFSFCIKIEKVDQSGDKKMSLKLISGMMKSSGDEALLVMDANGLNQMVVINGEALMSAAKPPRCDESRLQENIGTFSEIASAKYDRGDFESDGCIRITEKDLAAWSSSHKHVSDYSLRSPST